MALLLMAGLFIH